MTGAEFFLYIWALCAIAVFLFVFVWLPLPNNFYHVGKRENKMRIATALGMFLLAWSLLTWPIIIFVGSREYVRTHNQLARR